MVLQSLFPTSVEVEPLEEMVDDSSPDEAIVNPDAERAIAELSDRIQILLEPLDAPVFLRKIFCQALDWELVNVPVPMSVLPHPARDGFVEAHILAQCEGIRLCYFRAQQSEVMATEQTRILQRLSRQWPQVVAGFSNYGQNKLDIVIRTSEDLIRRVSLDGSLFGPGELAQALYSLRAFDVTSNEPPVLLEIAERLERQFKRLPRRLRSRVKRHEDPLFREIGRHKLLSASEEKQLRKQYESGMRHPARDKLVLANLRLVVWIAYRYRQRGIAWDDLLQIGVTGLIRAADKFDPAMGCKFSTYATWWIRQRISRAIEEDVNVVSLPCYHSRVLNSYWTLVRDHRLYFGCRPTDAEVRDFFQMNDDQWLTFRQALAAATRPKQFDTIGDTESPWIRLKFAHSRQRTCTFDRTVQARDNAHTIEKLLKTRLDSRSAEIVRRRFGLGECRPETLEEIGAAMGVTRERIRQIESKALRKLARPLKQLLGEPHWEVVRKRREEEEDASEAFESNQEESTDAEA